MALIAERYWKDTQSLHAEIITGRDSDGKRFRVVICRDAYDHQSYLRGYVLVNDSWNLIITKPVCTLSVKTYSYVTQDHQGWQDAAQRDLEAALIELYLIIPVAPAV